MKHSPEALAAAEEIKTGDSLDYDYLDTDRAAMVIDRHFATIRAEVERLRTEYAGTAVAIAESMFLLAGECGFGASSRPPYLNLRDYIYNLDKDKALLEKRLVEANTNFHAMAEYAEQLRSALNGCRAFIPSGCVELKSAVEHLAQKRE